MNQQKNKRDISQDYFGILTFDFVETYGHTSKNKLIDTLTVNFVPASFERLLIVRNAVKKGVGMAGTYIRASDIQTSTDGYYPGEVSLFFLPPTSSGVWNLKIHCRCHRSGTFITAEKEITSDWFENLQTLYSALMEKS